MPWRTKEPLEVAEDKGGQAPQTTSPPGRFQACLLGMSGRQGNPLLLSQHYLKEEKGEGLVGRRVEEMIALQSRRRRSVASSSSGGYVRKGMIATTRILQSPHHPPHHPQQLLPLRHPQQLRGRKPPQRQQLPLARWLQRQRRGALRFRTQEQPQATMRQRTELQRQSHQIRAKTC